MQIQPIPVKEKVRHGKFIQTKGPCLNEILEEICSILEESVDAVKGPVKTTELVICRQIYYYVAALITNARHEDITAVVNRDRTLVSYHGALVRGYLKRRNDVFIDQWDLYEKESKIWNEYKTI